MQTFKKITGGKENTPKEVFKKFPWLEYAKFKDAEIDISKNYLIWKDGTWEDGIWEGGTWEGGSMWDNISQSYKNVEYKDGKFNEIKL